MGYANSDTDGAKTFPANQYDLATEYGRSSLDSRHHLFIGGNVTAPKGVRFSPLYQRQFRAGRSTSPPGSDYYGDSLNTDRPSFAVAGQPGAIVTQWGIFNPNPGPNDPRIPRNYAEGPGYVSINLRMSRTWGFGPTRGGNAALSNADSGGGRDAAITAAVVPRRRLQRGPGGGGPAVRWRHAHGRQRRPRHVR